MFRRRHLAMICLSLAIWPLLARTEDTGRPPPEVKRTVDAFLGHWTLAGTDTEPTAKGPSKLSAVIDCQSAALGMAVACHIAADVSGAGRVEASTVIGYSPDERVVRWMEISSSGEYHDHRGPWVGNEIQFEPLAYSNSGQKATEYLTIGFPSPGMMTLNSVTETSDGKSILVLAGARHKKKAK